MKIKLIAMTLLAAGNIAYADTYNPATNQLSIPAITLPNGASFTNVLITVGNIVSFNTGTPGTADSYDPVANILTIPSITVAGTTYTNVKLTVGAVLGATAAGTTGATTSGADATAAFCSAAAAPAGFNYSQSGNAIAITTNGCVVLPTTSTGICNPSAPTATGINVLLTQNVQSMNWGGIKFNIPGLSDTLTSSASAMVGTTCIRNAPTGFSNQTLNANICLDVTQQFAPYATQFQGMVTVTNPVTMSYKGTTTMQTVADCTKSGATAIYDAFTKQALFKQADGTYK